MRTLPLVAFTLSVVALLALLLRAPPPSAAGEPPADPLDGVAELWSPERAEKALADGHPVFVVFTAEWCLSCKLNEKLYVHTEAVREAARKLGAVILVADFTNADARVIAELKKHGRAGVPQYMVLSPRPGRKPVLLPVQLTSSQQIVDALAEAAAPLAASRIYRTVLPDSSRGVIEGTVRLARTVPVPTLRRPKVCAGERDISWAERPADLVSFDAERLTLGDCLVSLRHIGQGKDWPTSMQAERRTFTLMVHDGMFVPRVRWVRTGTGVAFANEMLRTNVDVKAYFSQTSLATRAALQFNVMLSPGASFGPFDESILARPGLYTLNCHCNCLLHMHAQILTFDHPYVDGPTGRDGRYLLDDVPPGDYEVVCWHGPFTVEVREQPGGSILYDYGPVVESVQKVTVPARGRVTVDFVLDPPR
jgi:hypothetical protein